MALTFTRGTTVEFSGDAGADVAWSIEGKADTTGWESAQYDTTVSARTPYYLWRFHTQFQATPTLGEAVKLYLKRSDGTYIDNNEGTTDAVATAAKQKNCLFIGVVLCDEAAANIATSKSGVVEVYDRYIQVVMINDSGATTHATDTNSGFLLTPIDQADV